MDEFDEEKKIPAEPRKVHGMFSEIEYECPYCGEIDGIRPPMNNCPWCGQIFKWENYS